MEESITIVGFNKCLKLLDGGNAVAIYVFLIHIVKLMIIYKEDD